MPISTVRAMMPTRKGRFVRVSLNDIAHSIFRMTPKKCATWTSAWGTR